jgi:hypothetical protein
MGFHYISGMERPVTAVNATYFGQIQAEVGGHVLEISLEMHLPLLLPAVIRRRRRAANDNGVEAARAA